MVSISLESRVKGHFSLVFRVMGQPEPEITWHRHITLLYELGIKIFHIHILIHGGFVKLDNG